MTFSLPQIPVLFCVACITAPRGSAFRGLPNPARTVYQGNALCETHIATLVLPVTDAVESTPVPIHTTEGIL